MLNATIKTNKKRVNDNKLIPVIAIVFGFLGIFTTVYLINQPQNISSFAAFFPFIVNKIPAGCYYVRGNCTGPQTPGATGSCKPILVCPTATPTITPTATPTTATPTIPITPLPCVPRPLCLDATPSCKMPEPAEGWCPPVRLTCTKCLAERGSSLCLDLNNKISYCNMEEKLSPDPNQVCAPCKPMPPTPTPYKCIFRPPCLDASPPCTDQKPVEGWCTAGEPVIIFKP